MMDWIKRGANQYKNGAWRMESDAYSGKSVNASSGGGGGSAFITNGLALSPLSLFELTESAAPLVDQGSAGINLDTATGNVSYETAGGLGAGNGVSSTPTGKFSSSTCATIPSTGFTVETVWIPDTIGSGSAGLPFGKSGSTTQQESIRAFSSLTFFDVLQNGTTYRYTGGILTPGTLYHHVMVVEPSQTMKVYQNGSFLGASASTLPASLVAVPTNTLNVCESQSSGSPSISTFFVAYYPSILTAGDISTRYSDLTA